MKLRTFKIFDLSVLIILAIGLEMFTTYLGNEFLPTVAPYPVVGLVITLIAITRWGLVGAVVIPFNVLGNFIAGKFFISQTVLHDAYNYIWVNSLVTDLAVLFALIFFKKIDRRVWFKNFSESFKLTLYIVLISIFLNFMVTLIFNVIFGAINSESYKNLGQIIFSSTIYGSLGYVILLVGTQILRSQEVLVDVKEKLISKRTEDENESKYYSNKKEDHQNDD